jgi:hypothetical protein
MSDWHLTTPVVFIIYKRPETTARVFREIARAKPPVLFVVGDGPREDRPGEADKVARTRKIIEAGVDWNCEVLTNYSDVHLGCRRRISTGLDWVFQHVEKAIILEDDCLPHPSFFRFCEELLNLHEEDESIFAICGFFKFVRSPYPPSSYSRISFPLVWGWATWRRVWEQYDVDMKDWDGNIDAVGNLSTFSPQAKEYWREKFNAVCANKIDTWDYQFAFLVLRKRGYCLHPHRNLISNIGFGSDALHTWYRFDETAALPVESVEFPLRYVSEYTEYDNYLRNEFFVIHPMWRRAFKKFLLGPIVRFRNLFRL